MCAAGGGVNQAWDWNELSAVALRETMRVLRNHSDAEDASQEAVVRAYKARSGCATPGAPNPWIRAIARREAYRLYTRRAATQMLSEMAEGYSEDLSESVHAKITAEVALAGTTSTERSLLLRRYVLEQTSSEIGQDLGIPSATVRVNLHRASKRIRELAEAAA
jgi:RNA polymerase sigma-70 factor (ECF subfamily)